MDFEEPKLFFLLKEKNLINYQVLRNSWTFFYGQFFPLYWKFGITGSLLKKIKLKSFPGRSWHTIPFTAHFKFSEKIKCRSKKKIVELCLVRVRYVSKIEYPNNFRYKSNFKKYQTLHFTKLSKNTKTQENSNVKKIENSKNFRY